MPELPEVEVVRRGLSTRLPGRTVTAFACSGKTLRGAVDEVRINELVCGATVTEVGRRAKYLLISFDNRAVLILHLGMTGRLGLVPAERGLDPHDHLRWRLDDGRELRFNDARRFGSVRVLDPERGVALDLSVFGGAGPEPFSDDFNGRYLYEKARGRTQPVKNFIMDGRVVAGVGNIYANESLFGAAIRPSRKAGAISRQRYDLLAAELRQVLARAIDCGGSTISDFLDAGGARGYFQMHFNVYGRQGQPCSACATPIRQVRLGGRSSFFCPSCQR